jgi:ABC-type oligopeptide transport system substrate-binding subunit
MENAGFRIKQTPLDLGGWLTAYRAKDYDASLSLNQIYETAEIPLDFQHSKGPAGSDIYATGLQDPEIDAIIDATKSITDFDERVAAIQDAQRTIYEAGPAFLPFVTPFSRTLYWNYVKDVPTGLGSTGLFLTQNMWVDQSAAG